jgi:phosphoribosyl 1,2-cyclic phosphodiesterase
VEIFAPGGEFDAGPFRVRAFAVPHDALDPVGFVLTPSGADTPKVGVATDLGHLDNLVKARLAECDALVLECNHDLAMLRASDRALSLKRRIMGRFGHLNNEDSMEALGVLIRERTRHLVLYHLSGDCNDPSLVAELAEKRLLELERPDVKLTVAPRDEPSETLWVLPWTPPGE